MNKFHNLILKIENRIAYLTISRPAALNALNSETLTELTEALNKIQEMDDIRVLILIGGPDKYGNNFKSFVAGADISEMMNFNPVEARAFSQKAAVPFRMLQTMSQVTIAAINGYALGGGLELALSCDIRIASDNATFAQPETGLGIIPGFGGTARLPRLIGVGLAKELIFTGKSIDATEAYRIGLINRVVPADALLSTATDYANKIISRSSFAISLAKYAIDNSIHMELTNAIAYESELFAITCSTDEQKERMHSFKKPY